GLDKVLELSRFATADSERSLIAWARRVMPATVRHRADVACAPAREEVVEIERARYLRYWFQDEGASLCLEGLLPADQGAVVAQALDRMAGRMPDIVADSDDDPQPGFETSLEMRRADALYALASHRIASDADADRATVVVHAPLEALAGLGGGCETESGAVLHPDTARRLACDCRLELVLENTDGNALGIGQVSRTPPPWLMRQLRVRDRGCTFPGCGARWFLQAHHIKHWTPERGPTDLDNMVLACGFHHRLVHERGWDVRLGLRGESTWLRPDGTVFAPGVTAPEELPEFQSPMNASTSTSTFQRSSTSPATTTMVAAGRTAPNMA
ncbi:MAG: DUF222 domain-containing protein, partial [Candidatus Limnocylindria bacterium]